MDTGEKRKRFLRTTNPMSSIVGTQKDSETFGFKESKHKEL